MISIKSTRLTILDDDSSGYIDEYEETEELSSENKIDIKTSGKREPNDLSIAILGAGNYATRF